MDRNQLSHRVGKVGGDVPKLRAHINQAPWLVPPDPMMFGLKIKPRDMPDRPAVYDCAYASANISLHVLEVERLNSALYGYRGYVHRFGVGD